MRDQITALLGQIKTKDEVTFKHSLRVADLMSRFGAYLGKSEKEVEELRLAGLVHDCGKISIPDEVLNKPAKLTNEEFQIMRNHTVYSADLLKSVDSEVIKNVAIGHHLSFSGNGYPDAAKAGKDIPEECRIACVCDVFEALTAKRQYKEAMTASEAFKEMDKMPNFDPDLYESFKQMMNQ